MAGGVILGDLPPYEAFPIGGTNSVRGYSEGGVGSGRNYVAGTAALQWPIYGPVDVSRSDLPCPASVRATFKAACSHMIAQDQSPWMASQSLCTQRGQAPGCLCSTANTQ